MVFLKVILGAAFPLDSITSFEISEIQDVISKLNKYIEENSKEDYLSWNYDGKNIFFK